MFCYVATGGHETFHIGCLSQYCQLLHNRFVFLDTPCNASQYQNGSPQPSDTFDSSFALRPRYCAKNSSA